jgi:hypothetical protein
VRQFLGHYKAPRVVISRTFYPEQSECHVLRGEPRSGRLPTLTLAGQTKPAGEGVPTGGRSARVNGSGTIRGGNGPEGKQGSFHKTPRPAAGISSTLTLAPTRFPKARLSAYKNTAPEILTAAIAFLIFSSSETKGERRTT